MISFMHAKLFGRLALRSHLEVYCKYVFASTDKTKPCSVRNGVYNPSIIHTRCMAFLPTYEREFREKVGIPPGYELIYKPPLNKQVIAAQGVGALCALGATASCGFQFFTNAGFSPVDGHMFVSDYYELLIYLTGFVLINAGVFWVASTYIIRIYQRDKSYIAVIPRGTPALHSTILFSKGDVVQLRPSGVMPWKYSKFKIKDKSYIILSHHFRKPADFNNMLGIK